MILSGGNLTHVFGVLSGLFAAFSYSLIVVLLSANLKELDSITFSGLSGVFGLCIWPIFLLIKLTLIPNNPQIDATYCLFLSLGKFIYLGTRYTSAIIFSASLAGSFAIMTVSASVKYVCSTVVTVVGTLEIVMDYLVQIFVFKDSADIYSLGGSFIVLTSIVAVTLERDEKHEYESK